MKMVTGLLLTTLGWYLAGTAAACLGIIAWGWLWPVKRKKEHR